MNAYFRLVYSSVITFDKKDATRILDGLQQGNIDGDTRINNLREKYGADIVLLLVADPNPGYKVPKGARFCGRAGGILGAKGSPRYPGYTVINILCSFDNTASHEVGHLLGAQHDPDAHSGKLRIAGSNRGYVDYDKKLRTIMSYYTGCKNRGLKCNEIPVFSNPKLSLTSKNKTISNWAPGTPQNNNVARMKANMALVAGYRPRKDSNPPASKPTPPAVKPAPPAPKPAPPEVKPAPPAPKAPPEVKPAPPAPKPAPPPESGGWKAITY